MLVTQESKATPLAVNAVFQFWLWNYREKKFACFAPNIIPSGLRSSDRVQIQSKISLKFPSFGFQFQFVPFKLTGGFVSSKSARSEPIRFLFVGSDLRQHVFLVLGQIPVRPTQPCPQDFQPPPHPLRATGGSKGFPWKMISTLGHQTWVEMVSQAHVRG